ncbi:MAG: hypothetical protein RL362_348 [Bacteroidota bacterium]|jgi:hypothetical protein
MNFLLTPTLRPEENLLQDWMVLLFVLSLSFIAYFNTVYPTKIRNIFKAFRSDIFMRQLMREENILPRTHVYLTFQHAAVLGLFVDLAYQTYFPQPIPSWLFFLICFGGILLMYGIKWLAIYIVKWLADGDFTLSEYRYRTFAMNRLLAISALPFVVLLSITDRAFAPWFITALSILMLLLIVWRILKGAWTAFTNNVPLFYIFFYICTLEILPVWMGVVWITKISHA